MIFFLFLSLVCGQCTTTSGTPTTLFTTTPTSVLQWTRWQPTTNLDMGVYQSNVSSYLLGPCAMRNATLCLTPSLSLLDALFAAAYITLPTTTTAPANGSSEYADYALTYRFAFKDSGPLTEEAFGMSHYVGLDGGVGIVDSPNIASMAFYSGGLQQNFITPNTDTYWPTLVLGRLQPETYWCADFMLLGTNSTPPCRYVTDPRYTVGVRNGTYNATVVFRYANGTLWVRSAQTMYANGSTLLADPAPLPAWSATTLTHAPRRLFIMSVLSVLEIDSLSLTYTLCQSATTTKSTTRTTVQSSSSSSLLTKSSSSMRVTTTSMSTTTTMTTNTTSTTSITTTSTATTAAAAPTIPRTSTTTTATTTTTPMPTSTLSPTTSWLASTFTTHAVSATLTLAPPSQTTNNVNVVAPSSPTSVTLVSSGPNETKLIAMIALTTALVVCCFVACVAARKRVRASRAWIAVYRRMPTPLRHACCTKTRIADADDSQDNDNERLAERIMRAPNNNAQPIAAHDAAVHVATVAARRANTDVSAITIPVVAKTMQLPPPLTLRTSSASEYTAIPIVNDDPGMTVSLPPPPPPQPASVTPTRQPVHAYDRVRTKQAGGGAVHYDRVSAVGKLPGEYDQVESPLN